MDFDLLGPVFLFHFSSFILTGFRLSAPSLAEYPLESTLIMSKGSGLGGKIAAALRSVGIKAPWKVGFPGRALL